MTSVIFCCVMKRLIFLITQERTMNLENYLEELRRKHFQLDEKINFEQKQPQFAELEIKLFKKQKLCIKDQIKKITSRIVYN